MDLKKLGVSDRDEQFAGVVRIGDGFSGFEAALTTFDLAGTNTGTLTTNWGNLMQGDVVRTNITGSEIRARYIAEFFDYENESEALFQFGAGLSVAHRELTIRAREANGLRAQNITMNDDGIPFVDSRIRATYREFGFQVDYAINPDVNFGGDFDGVMQDLGLTATYTFEDQDLKLSAGFRRSDFTAKGSKGGLAHETDFIVEGFVLGAELTF